MNDRELLELAAKAAGIPINAWRYREQDATWHGERADCEEAIAYWSPLTDDGDALRLAVKLNLQITCDEEIRRTETHFNKWAEGGWLSEDWLPDPYVATRRAIVRAAAEIGKEQPK